MAWTMQNELRNIPHFKNCFETASKLLSEVSDYVFSAHALFQKSPEKQKVKHYPCLAIAQVQVSHYPGYALGRLAQL